MVRGEGDIEKLAGGQWCRWYCCQRYQGLAKIEKPNPYRSYLTDQVWCPGDGTLPAADSLLAAHGEWRPAQIS